MQPYSVLQRSPYPINRERFFAGAERWFSANQSRVVSLAQQCFAIRYHLLPDNQKLISCRTVAFFKPIHQRAIAGGIRQLSSDHCLGYPLT